MWPFAKQNKNNSIRSSISRQSRAHMPIWKYQLTQKIKIDINIKTYNEMVLVVFVYICIYRWVRYFCFVLFVCSICVYCCFFYRLILLPNGYVWVFPFEVHKLCILHVSTHIRIIYAYFKWYVIYLRIYYWCALIKHVFADQTKIKALHVTCFIVKFFLQKLITFQVSRAIIWNKKLSNFELKWLENILENQILTWRIDICYMYKAIESFSLNLNFFEMTDMMFKRSRMNFKYSNLWQSFSIYRLSNRPQIEEK